MSKSTGTKGMTAARLSRVQRAEGRKAVRESRSPETQLAELNLRPGKASRERRRLLALVAASQPVVTANPGQRQRRRAARRKAGAA